MMRSLRVAALTVTALAAGGPVVGVTAYTHSPEEKQALFNQLSQAVRDDDEGTIAKISKHAQFAEDNEHDADHPAAEKDNDGTHHGDGEYLLHMRDPQSGQAPLMMAVLMGKEKAVKELLSNKHLDYLIPEKDGYTPMHGAGFQGRAKILEYLVRAYLSKRGPAPLNSNQQDVKIAGRKVGSEGELLFGSTAKAMQEKGVGLFEKHQDGFYPMHRACWGGEQRHTDTVRVFLKAGVPFDLKSDSGTTCMEMTQNKRTKKLLKKWQKKKEKAAAGSGSDDASGKEKDSEEL